MTEEAVSFSDASSRGHDDNDDDDVTEGTSTSPHTQLFQTVQAFKDGLSAKADEYISDHFPILLEHVEARDQVKRLVMLILTKNSRWSQVRETVSVDSWAEMVVEEDDVLNVFAVSSPWIAAQSLEATIAHFIRLHNIPVDLASSSSSSLPAQPSTEVGAPAVAQLQPQVTSLPPPPTATDVEAAVQAALTPIHSMLAALQQSLTAQQQATESISRTVAENKRELARDFNACIDTQLRVNQHHQSQLESLPAELASLRNTSVTATAVHAILVSGLLPFRNRLDALEEA